MEFAEFAAWRKRVGITQEELAERWAGVTRTTIQNWESGATPIPRAVQSACAIWERRLKQENGKLGPVTLIYADGPMFIDPYGPRRRLAMMQQEPYQTNTAALARVRQLWGSEHFYNPFIIEKDGSDLWNAAELRRVVDGDDAGAPTLENLLRRLAKRVKQTSDLFVRSGPKLLTGTAAKQRQAQIEALAEEIADVAAGRPIRRETVDELLIRLRGLGKFPPDELVFNIAQAFVDASTGRPER